MELREKKIGLVGLGNTGYTTARVAIGFGMQVYALTSKSHFQLPPEIKKMDLDQLFSECDIISLHCPLTPETREMVNARRLGMMKPTAILINTGRTAYQRTRPCRRFEQWQDLCSRSRRAFY